LNLFLDLEASSWIDTVPNKSSSPDDDTVMKWDDYSPALLKKPVSQPLLITISSDIYSVNLLNKYYCRQIDEFRSV